MKNWTVKFKTIKNKQQGLFNYMSYLTNDNHKNHNKEGHNIINVLENDYKHYFINLSNLIEEEQKTKIMNGVGGRPNSKYGQSITLNLTFHLQEDDYKKIGDKILLKFIKSLNKTEGLKINTDMFNQMKKDLLYYNIHTQNTGSKTQFNFVLPETFNNKKLDLSKKKYSYLFKIISNEVLREFGHDIDSYEFDNKYKQYKSIKDYKMNKIDTLLTNFKDLYQEHKEDYKEFLKDFNTIDTYLKRTSKHISQGHEEEALKVIDRLYKSFSKIDKKIKETTTTTDKMTNELNNIKKGITETKEVNEDTRLNSIYIGK